MKGSILSLFPENFAATLGTTLMHSLWQIALITLGLLFVLMFIPGARSKTRYNLSLISLLLMVALPVATWFYVADLPAPITETHTAFSVSPVSPTNIPVFGMEATQPSAWTLFVDTLTGFFRENGQFIALLWVLGALFFSIRVMGGFIFLRKLKKDWSTDASYEWIQWMDEARERLGIRQRVRLMKSARVTAPIVIGTLQPVILLPAGMLHGLSRQEIEYMLLHELAHIVRRDFLVNVLQSVAEVLLFFHPGVWIVSKMIREERENCVDQMVVDFSGDKKAYANALLNLETLRQGATRLAPAANDGQLLRRIKKIMGMKDNRQKYSVGIIALLFSTLILVTIATGLGDNIKAAVFPQDQANEEDKIEDKSKCKKSDSKSTVYSTSENCKKKAFTVKSIEHVLDTPKMIVTILENEEEVRMVMDENGKLTEVTIDGKPVPAEEFDHYAAMADEYFMRHHRVAVPSMPPMPPMPSFGSGENNLFAALGEGLSEMMEGLGGMFSDMPVFEKDGQFGESMSELMRNLEVLMEGVEDGEEPDPEKMAEFERKMEKWEAEFEDGFGKDMEAWGEKWEKWGEQFEKDFEAKFDDKKMEEWGKQWEEWGTQFEKNFDEAEMEEFAAKMEAWGEEFGKKFGEDFGEDFGDEWAEEFEAKMEEFGERMEEWGERFEEEMEAKAERKEAEMEKESYVRLSNKLEKELLRDGLVEESGSYKLKINDREMSVNGNKVDDRTYRKYSRIVQELTKEKLDKDGISIRKKVNR